MPLPVKEKDVLRSILELLNLMNVPFVRVNNTGAIFKDKNGEMQFARRAFDQKGAADICCAWKGKPVAIEVKSSEGKLSKEQINWLQNWETKGGGVFVVAHDVEQVSEFLNNL